MLCCACCAVPAVLPLPGLPLRNLNAILGSYLGLCCGVKLHAAWGNVYCLLLLGPCSPISYDNEPQPDAESVPAIIVADAPAYVALLTCCEGLKLDLQAMYAVGIALQDWVACTPTYQSSSTSAS